MLPNYVTKINRTTCTCFHNIQSWLLQCTFHWPSHTNMWEHGTYLQELMEDWEERPSSPQQQGQHGLSCVHVQTPLVLILRRTQKHQDNNRECKVLWSCQSLLIQWVVQVLTFPPIFKLTDGKQRCTFTVLKSQLILNLKYRRCT